MTIRRLPAAWESADNRDLVFRDPATGLWSTSPLDPGVVGSVVSGMALPFTLYGSYAAGTVGSADDVTVFSANAPFAFRIIRVELIIATAIALSTMVARSASGGGGSALSSTFTSAAAGIAAITVQWTATTTVAAAGSLFLRRSDRAVAGEYIITAVRT